MVIMVMGLPGSGKSFFASRLAGLLHADYISSDKIRKDMISQRTYSIEEKEWVYDEMLKHMEVAVHEKKTVVLDATFFTCRLREKFSAKASPVDTLALIEVKASEATIKNRLTHRRKFSEADFEVYQQIKSEWEPIREKHLTLESTQNNLHMLLQKAIRYLHMVKHENRTDQ